MPIAIVIVLIVALIMLGAAFLDSRKPDGGNPMRRKHWRQTALIMLFVSIVVLVFGATR